MLQNSSDTAIVLSGCGISGRLAFLLAIYKFSQLAKAQQLLASYDYLNAGGDIALLKKHPKSDNWKQGREDLEKVSSNKTRVLFIGVTCGFQALYVAAQFDYCMDKNILRMFLSPFSVDSILKPSKAECDRGLGYVLLPSCKILKKILSCRVNDLFLKRCFCETS